MLLGQTGVTNAIINSNDGMYFNIDSDSSGGTPEFMFGKQRNGAGSGGTTFMTISNSGNVGINTVTPTAAKLVVLSSDTTITMFGQNIDSSTTLGNAFVSRFRNGFDGNGLYSLTSFQVQNAAGTDQISFIGAQSVTGAGNYSPNTVFGVRSGSSTFAEYMRIVGSTGNLLVNTQTDSGEKLQVNGDISINKGGSQVAMFNTSGTTLSLALGGTADFANFSGMLLVNCYQTGTFQIFVCGGGGTASVYILGPAIGTFTYNPGINGYTFTSTTAISTYNFTQFKTRVNA